MVSARIVALFKSKSVNQPNSDNAPYELRDGDFVKFIDQIHAVSAHQMELQQKIAAQKLNYNFRGSDSSSDQDSLENMFNEAASPGTMPESPSESFNKIRAQHQHTMAKLKAGSKKPAKIHVSCAADPNELMRQNQNKDPQNLQPGLNNSSRSSRFTSINAASTYKESQDKIIVSAAPESAIKAKKKGVVAQNPEQYQKLLKKYNSNRSTASALFVLGLFGVIIALTGDLGTDIATPILAFSVMALLVSLIKSKGNKKPLPPGSR